jgi:phytoene desaturase
VLSADGSYDVVVIGAGLGGLSAGASLAKAGKRVLIAERNEGPGGNARAFRRGPYTFDPAVHLTAHGFQVEFLEVYLAGLGIADDVELVSLDEMFAVEVCGSRFTLPVGIAAVIEYLAEMFPAESGGIKRYIETCAQATIESQAPPPRVALKDLDAVAAALPTLFRYRNQTLASVLEEFIADPQARSVLAAQWPYMGLPPSRLSFMSAIAPFMSFMERGPVYVRGSFQRLADALAGIVLDRGGSVLYGASVSRIDLNGGRVAGVQLEDGRAVRAPVVVSNADAQLTFEKLVGAEHIPHGYLRRLRRMRPSISAFMVYSACTLPLHELGLAPEVFVYDHWDHEQTWTEVMAGSPGGTWLSIPTLIDDSLAPGGEHLLMFTTLMPYDIGEPWSDARSRLADELVDRVEALLPGYRQSITFIENATPVTFQNYTLARDGAIYGWENTPAQTLPKRLSHQSPVPGVVLAGHWTNPGSGSLRCLLSGLQAAATIEGQPDPIAFLAAIR